MNIKGSKSEGVKIKLIPFNFDITSLSAISSITLGDRDLKVVGGATVGIVNNILFGSSSRFSQGHELLQIHGQSSANVN